MHKVMSSKPSYDILKLLKKRSLAAPRLVFDLRSRARVGQPSVKDNVTGLRMMLGVLGMKC